MSYPRWPIDFAVTGFLDNTYPDEDSIPVAYREVIEVAFSDALCDVPTLDQWRADHGHMEEAA